MTDKNASVPRIVGVAYARFGLKPGSRIGIAFSGGADSLALLAASRECGMECVALHCNFRLRGDESGRDEQIALRAARRLGTEVMVKWFDAAQYSRRHGISIEMACRELRYRWFEQCREGLHLDAIAVGHNAGDNLETFFLNLARGTGLRGLAGIPQQRQWIVRPMLEVGRKDIIAYLEQLGLASENEAYAVDSTNLLPIYARNRVRLQLLPAVEQAMPELVAGIERTMANLRRDSSLLDELVEMQCQHTVEPDGTINLASLLRMRNAAEMLFHILNAGNPGRVDFDDSARIVEMARRGASGLVFAVDSGKEEYLLDRGCLRPRKAATGLPESVLTDAEEWLGRGVLGFGEWLISARVVTEPLPRLIDEMIALHKKGKIDGFALFDYDAIKGMPLEIRSWRDGDFIEPLGMRGRKKLSDIFKDGKIPLDRKGSWPVVCATGEVIWVAGLRQSRHFQIPDDETARKKLLLCVQPR